MSPVDLIVGRHLAVPLPDPDATLAGLGADELDVLELVLALERIFRVSIPDEAGVTGETTVADLGRVVERAMERKKERVEL